jgi:hypothetical protein
MQLDPGAWSQTWRRLTLPDARWDELGVAGTPSGWFAVSSVMSGESYVYRSSDGTHWQRVTLTDHDENLRLKGVAYGGGRYVIVGGQRGRNLVLSSTDGERWREAPPDDMSLGLESVTYVQGRFFGMDTGVWSSADAEHWVQSKLEQAFAPQAVAFGAGQFFLAGIGAPQLSTDGVSWRAAPIDCALASACFTDELDGVPINQYRNVFFADGYFYLNQLRSRDGQLWEQFEAPAPTGYLGGRLLQVKYDGSVKAWPVGGTPEAVDVLEAPEVPELGAGPLPQSLDYSWSDGLDCSSAKCVLLGKNLYLIP